MPVYYYLCLISLVYIGAVMMMYQLTFPKLRYLLRTRKYQWLTPSSFFFFLLTLTCCFWLVYIFSLALVPPLPSYPSKSSQNTELGSLCYTAASCQLASYFTHGKEYMSMHLSQFIQPFPSPTMSTHPFSISVSLFLPCK